MRHINKYLLYLTIAFMPIAGCDTEELHDLNVNPQALNTVPLQYLFTAAQLGSASGGSAGDNRYIDWRTNIGFAGYAIQQLSTATGGISPGDKYFENAESYAAPWEFIYGDQLKNLAEIIKQTGPGGFDEGNNNNLRQAARILRAFNFHRLTDYYGNIPYSDALQGIEGTFLPEYDTQEAIYADLLKELEEATAALTPLSGTVEDNNFAQADLFYNGNIDQWKKFGYSLMLRLAMRVSNVAPDMANEYVAKAVAGGVFTSNEDNVWVPMSEGPNEWTNQNGISRAFAAGDGGQPTTLSATLINEMLGGDGTADDDPRLRIISQGIQGDPTNQRGLPNGLDQGMVDELMGQDGVVVSENFSQINEMLLQDDDPYLLMHYAEVEFLLAEAAERGIGGVPAASAEEHYNAGVRAAMQMYTPFDPALTVSDAEVNAYLAARPYPAGASLDEKLEEIGTQLWLSKFFNWWDAWADWRRTGYPTLTPTNYPGNVTNGTIPRKLRLPAHEVATNPNYATGATMPDAPTTRVWWDVN